MVNSRFPLKKCHAILISTDKYCLQCRFDELNIAMFSYFKKDRELTSDITIPGTASTSGQYSLTGNTWNVTTFVIWMYCTWNIIHLNLNCNYFYRSSKIISKILNSTRLKKIKTKFLITYLIQYSFYNFFRTIMCYLSSFYWLSCSNKGDIAVDYILHLLVPGHRS